MDGIIEAMVIYKSDSIHISYGTVVWLPKTQQAGVIRLLNYPQTMRATPTSAHGSLTTPDTTAYIYGKRNKVCYLQTHTESNTHCTNTWGIHQGKRNKVQELEYSLLNQELKLV